MSTTALEIITDAYAIPNVFLAGESLPPGDAQLAFRTLNRFVGQLGLQAQTYPSVSIETYPIVANKETYTIGPGGDLNTVRPPTQAALGTSISLLLNASAPQPVEIPYPLVSDDVYQNIRIKNLPNTLFTAAWYNPTYAGGLGQLSLWPVPDNAVNSIRLYRKANLPLFSSLTAVYDLPLGYDEMFVYNLARRLAGLSGRTLLPDDLAIARTSLRMVKVSNVKIVTLEADPMFLQYPRQGIYNITTGE